MLETQASKQRGQLTDRGVGDACPFMMARQVKICVARFSSRVIFAKIVGWGCNVWDVRGLYLHIHILICTDDNIAHSRGSR